MQKPRLPLNTDEPLAMPRPVPKPSQSTKKRGRKTKETSDETKKTEQWNLQSKRVVMSRVDAGVPHPYWLRQAIAVAMSEGVVRNTCVNTYGRVA